jgi:hypothetical protein
LTSGFDAEYWNLSQAAAWVVFRDRSTVDKFGGHSPESWSAYMAYHTMWLCEPVGELTELHHALLKGRLTAMGHADHAGANMEVIPAIEWETLILTPPAAYRRLSNNVKDVPWQNIRVASADIKRLWRAPTEVDSRFQHNWNAIKAIFLDVQKRCPDFSQNDLISETQQEFQDRFKKEPPSRTSFQRHLKDWD